MNSLSDEGGAAGLEPIEDALEELEDEDMSLPEGPIEDIVGDVDGVKRHVDGDYVDTTQLEGKSMKLTKQQLKRIIKEEKAKLVAENRIRKAVCKALLKESHPYDVSINDAVDAGYFSNSDAVDEVQGHLRSAGAEGLVDEIEMMVDYGDDDIYQILSMIPKQIKDKLPLG